MDQQLPLLERGGPTSSRKERIDRERIHLLFEQSGLGVVTTIISALILVFLLRNLIDTAILTGWLAAIFMVSLLRILLVFLYLRKSAPENAPRWRRWNIFIVGVAGLIWGSSAWLLFPETSAIHQFLLAFLLYGTASAAALGFAVMVRAFLAFSVPMMVPLFLRLVTLPGEEYLLMALTTVIFWVFSFMICGNQQRIRLNLLHLKEDLADRVTQRTAALAKANEMLRSENGQRIQMEEGLRQERDRLETITGNIGAGLAVISRDYKILWANRVLKSIFGEVVGRSCFETVYKDQDQAACNARRVLEEGCAKAIQEQSGVDTQGTVVWSQTITTPIHDSSGRITAALELVLPLTDLKKAQEDKQRMAVQLEEARKAEAIATLAGGMAHQFNNALAVIVGNAELLQFDYGGQEAIREHIAPMMRAAAQMSQMTDQLLAYAKGGKYKPKPTQFAAFVNDTLALVQHTLPAKVSLDTVLNQKLPRVVMDVTQMQMVLSAVVANAIEAMPQGGRISIECSNHRIDPSLSTDYGGLQQGDYVSLIIRDQGTGMDRETLQRIFEPFFSTKFQGRGLGMAAVYGIVRNHGGHIAVASEPGQGTQVGIYLPAMAAPDETAVADASQKNDGNGSVLLIEDEQMVRDVNRALLGRMGYRVICARTGKEAIEQLYDRQNHLDLVLLDIKLPDMDGAAILPIVRRQRPEAKVIVCSGYTLDGPNMMVMDADADGFIQKPFSMSEMAEKIDEVMAKR